MARIGEWIALPISHQSSAGLYLQAGDPNQGGLGEVLLPNKEVAQLSKPWKPGDLLQVFLYRDSEDRAISTIHRPKALPGECHYLPVIQTSPVGAFVDWGLPKDLLLPFREQTSSIRKGHSYVLYIMVDPKSDRLLATQRIQRQLNQTEPFYEEGEEVELLIYSKTDLGYKAVINDEHTGLIFKNEVFQPLNYGDRIPGYIKTIRPDHKIDLSLYPKRSTHLQDLENEIINALKAQNGSLSLHDRSSKEEIYRTFGVSKKAFKRALGVLLRKEKITLDSNGIHSI